MKTNCVNIILLFAFLTTPFLTILSQNENNYWYFGNNAGLDFSSGSAVPITGNLNTFEGCASISASSGSLLFYTDGITVYNKTGAVMTNGNGLLGNPSSTSSAIIVPRPCSNTEYYIFTVDYVNGTNGINYSLVDMDDDGSGVYDPVTENGSVIAGMKNINMPGPTGEKICAIKHSNGIDYWVTATQMNTNNYYTYLISPSGVSTTPNVQSLGSNIAWGFYMKFSPDTTKMARANGVPNGQVYLYDFDNTNGLISNEQLLGTVPTIPYGLEFSTDSQKLFYSDFANGNGTGTGYIYEITIAPTIGSPVQIAAIPNQGGRYAVGALQQSPVDPNIIYAAMDGENFLGAIDVAASTFDRTALPLSNTSYLGLPTFISGNFNSGAGFQPHYPAVPSLISAGQEILLGADPFNLTDKELGDHDNDGDLDLYFLDSNSQINYFENTAGSGNFPIYSASPSQLAVTRAESYRLYDWDGDGWQDWVVKGENPSNGDLGVFVYLNNGNGTFIVTPDIEVISQSQFAFNFTRFIEVGDLNNDGSPDLLLTVNINGSNGTYYYENNGANNCQLVAPQNWDGTTMTNPFIPAAELGSTQYPILYDADFDNDEDILISDPIYNGMYTSGGRVYFHENFGGTSSGVLPNFDVIGLDNQFGLEDIPNNTDYACDWIVTRIEDILGNGCPVAISYNFCNSKFFIKDQICDCVPILGVSEFNGEINNENVILYPNPTASHFNIKLSSTAKIDTVVIYSITGVEIQRTEFTDTAIDVSPLSTGIYFVRVSSEGKTITKKLIKN